MGDKVIVAGSRSITDHRTVDVAIQASPHTPFNGELVTGDADGVDAIAREYGSWFKHIDVTVFEADWAEHGRAAGPIRNQEMAEYADGLIAVWDGGSNGTRDMIERALDEGCDVYVRVIGGGAPDGE